MPYTIKPIFYSPRDGKLHGIQFINGRSVNEGKNKDDPYWIYPIMRRRRLND